VAGLLVAAYSVVLVRRGVQLAHRDEQPTWPRYHVRFYTFALLFIAFDMEMAYMYPWAAVFRSLGVIAYGEIGFGMWLVGSRTPAGCR
jgi:NADH:ubiquinone oxidoreductase subunit 3 (subunit A)